MMTDDQILEVVRARKEGKRIQWKEACASQLSWINLPRSTSGYQEWTWDFINCDYRVAPEPRKPREWIVHIPQHGVNTCGTRVDIFPGSEWHGKFPVPEAECIRVREVME